MRFYRITDTTTGKGYNSLASCIDGAKAGAAAQIAAGQPGRRGRVIAGTRYEVEGETFDVELYSEALQGAQPSRAARQADARKAASRPRTENIGARYFPGLKGFDGDTW